MSKDEVKGPIFVCTFQIYYVTQQCRKVLATGFIEVRINVVGTGEKQAKSGRLGSH